MRAALEEALRDRRFVRLTRPFEGDWVRGYVVGLGAEFLLLAVVSDRIWFDGFECFRIEDVSEVEADPYAAFTAAALKARGEVPPAAPDIRLDAVGDLLVSAAAAFPLVTISCEGDEPDICNIGQVMSIEGGIVWMLEINPAAVWEEAPQAHKLMDITRVAFGGDYEAALALVGGPAPSLENRAAVPLRLVTP